MIYCSNVDACWSSRSLEGKDRGVHPLPKTSRGKSSVQATCLTDWRGRATQNGFSTTNRLLSRVPVTGSRILDTIVLSTLLAYYSSQGLAFAILRPPFSRRQASSHASPNFGGFSTWTLLVARPPQFLHLSHSTAAACRHIAYPRAQGHWKSLKRLGASAPLQHL